MGTPKQKQQSQPEQTVSKSLTKKRKTPLSSGPEKSNAQVNKTAEFKRINPKKKQKKPAFISAEVGKQKNHHGKARELEENVGNDDVIQQPTASQQLSYFVHQYRSANGVQLSSLELDSLKDASMLDLGQGTEKNISSLVGYVKIAFGSSWKEMLCEQQLKAGNSNPGNPALIVVSSSALRSLELLRELRPLTKDCPAVKLFSKHMKIEEQVSLLKNHVNIACGTPSRIKKLIDLEALGLSRLALVVVDMHRDVKGYSLLTLPQVREEFWDLYKRCFHEKLLEGRLRLRLYGSIPSVPAAAEAVDV